MQDKVWQERAEIAQQQFKSFYWNSELMEGAAACNGGTLLHNYYDDMEWMASALLRAYDDSDNVIFLIQ